MDFRIAAGHVHLTLSMEIAKTLRDFELKILRIHAKTTKFDESETKFLPWTVQKTFQNREISEIFSIETLQKSTKSWDLITLK